MQMYGFFRSGTSHRLRIALALKGLDFELVPVNLRAGEHFRQPFIDLNPQGLVPALEVDGAVLSQSPAIIEYLEERYPTPPLLPADMLERARARAMAALIGCDIHPINNLRVLNALRARFHAEDEAVKAWCATWIRAGFDALEKTLPDTVGAGAFAFGDRPGLVEVYLVPQVYSARRFEVLLSSYPKILALDAACAEVPAFVAAHPDNQPDAA